MEELDFRLPDRIVCPVASGSLYTKIAKGFSEWKEAGLVDGELPIMHGAQPLGCSPVAQAYKDEKTVCQPVKPDTLVTSLAIGNPADGVYALEVARESGGSIEAVTDQEMKDGVRLLAETTGVFTESAGGVATALLSRLAEEGKLGSQEEVVLYITGSGLKTAETIAGDDLLGLEIQPTVESYDQIIEGS